MSALWAYESSQVFHTKIKQNFEFSRAFVRNSLKMATNKDIYHTVQTPAQQCQQVDGDR